MHWTLAVIVVAGCGGQAFSEMQGVGEGGTYRAADAPLADAQDPEIVTSDVPDVLPGVADAGPEVLPGAVDAAPEAFQDVTDAAPEALLDVVDASPEALPDVADAPADAPKKDIATCLAAIPPGCGSCPDVYCFDYVSCYRRNLCDPSTPCGALNGVCGANTIGGGFAPEAEAVQIFQCACP